MKQFLQAFTAFILLLSGSISAQSLEQKYSVYRQRLIHEFMLGVGSGFGESLPASSRNTFDRTYNGHHTIKWGDATIDLAYYMAVLATEYKLLQMNGKNTDSTVRELYYALEAFNRLDYYAEEYFGAKPSLNGFFVRDDVGRGLYQGKSFNSAYNDVLKQINSKAQYKISGEAPFRKDDLNKIESDWIHYFIDGKNKHFAMSKDQTFHLFIAAACIVKCIPETTTYGDKKFLDGETSLHAEAIKITARIIDYMHLPQKSNVFFNWRVRMPDGKKTGSGYNAWTYARGLSLVENKVAQKKNPRQRGISWFLAKLMYNFTWTAFRPIFFFNQSEGSKTLSLVVANNSAAGNADKVYRYSHMYSRYPNIHIPMLFHFLYNKKAKALDYKSIQKLLEQAPLQGPNNYSELPANQRNYNWSSTSITMHPQRRGSLRPDFPGYYNGLDFMLLYNLWRLGRG